MKVGIAETPVTPPQAPVLRSPANDSANVPVSYSLAWNSVSGATTYEAQLSTRADFATKIFDSTGLTATTTSFTGLATSTKYFWRVRGANSAGAGIWSAVWSFTTVAPGAPTTAPTLLSPANDSTGVPLSRTLVWNGISGINSYQLELSTSADFTTKLVDTSGLAATSFAVSGMAENTLYYWRVRGANAAGSGPWSPVWSFTTLTVPKAPAAPELVAPGNGTSGIARNAPLVWDSVPGAMSYHLQLTIRSDFSLVQFDTAGLTTTTFTTPKLASSTIYYWRVSATNDVGEGAWSSAWSFETIGASGVPLEVVPAAPLHIYPNPATDNVTIEVNLPHAGVADLSIVNRLGEKLADLSSRVVERDNVIQLSTAGLPSGEYFCKLDFDGAVHVMRIVVVR
jgi:hypothetical protein